MLSMNIRRMKKNSGKNGSNIILVSEIIVRCACFLSNEI